MRIKTIAKIALAQANLEKLKRIDLGRSCISLGKDAYQASFKTAELSILYDRVRAIEQQIEELDTVYIPNGGEGIADKVKDQLQKVRRAMVAAKLGYDKKVLFREIGEKVAHTSTPPDCLKRGIARFMGIQLKITEVECEIEQLRSFSASAPPAFSGQEEMSKDDLKRDEQEEISEGDPSGVLWGGGGILFGVFVVYLSGWSICWGDAYFWGDEDLKIKKDAFLINFNSEWYGIWLKPRLFDSVFVSWIGLGFGLFVASAFTVILWESIFGHTRDAWFYVENMQYVGPVSHAEIQSLLTSGEITPDTLVWNEAVGDWYPIHQLKTVWGTNEKVK